MKNSLKIICGHYGVGKTNLALNLAIEEALKGEKVVLVDMDIVNPYFRSCEYLELLKSYGVELISPNLANTTLESSSLSAKIYSIFSDANKKFFIDLGGDDVGATALGIIREKITDYEMFYVINKNRFDSKSVEECLLLLKEIENVCRLKATAVINNTHLGVLSSEKDIDNSIEFANEFCKTAKLPLLYSTIPDFANENNKYKIIKRYVKFPWE